MQEEAIVTAVVKDPKRIIGESLDFQVLHVSFRVLRLSRYQDRPFKVMLTNPPWISDLQPEAPLSGYLMEHGEFSADLAEDGRITEGLKVGLEVTDL
jgi:hypothetical protein